jgi:hypothetical protein
MKAIKEKCDNALLAISAYNHELGVHFIKSQNPFAK